MSDLKDQTVVVVGASSGIGRATARAASARGCEGDAPGSFASEARGGRPQRGAHGLAAAGDELASRGRITTLTPEQVERNLDKLRGYVNVARAAAPRLRERG